MALVKERGKTSFIPSLRDNLSEVFDFDHMFDRPLFETLRNGNKFSRIPATNIRETNKEYLVELAAPGMKKSDFHVDIDNDLLEIKVEKEEESKDKGENFTRREYDFTSFYRSFNLPDSVHSEKIKAEYQDGILKVHIPKVEETQKKTVKEIAVK